MDGFILLYSWCLAVAAPHELDYCNREFKEARGDHSIFIRNYVYSTTLSYSLLLQKDAAIYLDERTVSIAVSATYSRSIAF